MQRMCIGRPRSVSFGTLPVRWTLALCSPAACVGLRHMLTLKCDVGPDARKGTSSVIVLMRDGVVVWNSKLQSVVVASACEAEYIGNAGAVKELLWKRKRLIKGDHIHTFAQGAPNAFDTCGASWALGATTPKHPPSPPNVSQHGELATNGCRCSWKRVFD